MSTPEQPVSQATQYVLYAAGLGALVLVLYLIWGVVSLMGKVIGFAQRSSKASAKTKVKQQPEEKEQKEAVAPASSKARGPDLKSLIKESEKANKKQVSKEDAAAAHELWVNTLKGHGDTVNGIAWSKDARQLATACEDMYLRLYDLGSDVTNKDPKFRRVKTPRIPVGVGFGDAPGSLAASMRGVPDAVAALFAPGASPNEAAYEIKWQVEGLHGKEPCLAMTSVPADSALGGSGLVFSLSQKKELRVLAASSGRELAVLEPASLANHDLVVSGDGRFVAVPSFTADLKIWELKYDRERVFKGASKAMDLKGHKSAIITAAISPDGKRAATVSKDLTLRLWNIDVRYALSEDPKTLAIVPVPLPGGKVYQRMAYGPHGVIAASHEGLVHFLSATSGELLESINAHDSTITMMRWSPVPVKVPCQAQPVFVLATSSRDKRVRLWRSP